ncbi:MAG: ATP-binding protein [Bacteroidia bacterium]
MFLHEHSANDPSLYGSDDLLNDAGIITNCAALDDDYKWVQAVFEQRIRFKDEQNNKYDDNWLFTELPPPDINVHQGPYAALVQYYNLNAAERFLLLLTLSPHQRPFLLSEYRDAWNTASHAYLDRLGGVIQKASRRFIPTMQTILYMLAGGNNMEQARYWKQIFADSTLIKEQIIVLKICEDNSPSSIAIQREQAPELAPEFADFLLYGREPRPDYGRDFPATLLTTKLEWKNLIVQRATMREIKEVMKWAKIGPRLAKRAAGTLKATYPVLFYGPPGTGKSFTAALIGKEYGKHVFRVDLSQIVSKWVGETEKNLARLFDRAQSKNWILFFDEADALFAQRTNVSDAKDKWANLEMSYLLQRIEEFDGLCILATNLLDNLDGAMRRRFRIMTHFPRPKRDERLQIWKLAKPAGYDMPPDLKYDVVAGYDLTGANIANIVFNCCVAAEERGETVMNTADMSYFINLEFSKENRTPDLYAK